MILLQTKLMLSIFTAAFFDLNKSLKAAFVTSKNASFYLPSMIEAKMRAKRRFKVKFNSSIKTSSATQ